MDQNEDGAAFTVLFVCTGNICRSPLAEQIFTAQVDSASHVITASSAGTYARPGQQMTSQAAALSVLHGGDPRLHQASELTEERIDRANLVLAMTREHRAAIVSMVPRASRTTFTLREFGRLLETNYELAQRTTPAAQADSVDALDEFVRDIAAMRGFSRTPVVAADDDIVDPYRRSQDTYDEVGRIISQSITGITDAFLGEPRGLVVHV